MIKIYKNINITKRLCMMVIGHYQDLYDTLEVQSIPEIAAIIGVDKETVRSVLKIIYDGPKADGSFSKRDLMILLCTRFGNGSPYLEDQQNEKIQRLIKRRKIMHELKSCIKDGILEETTLNEEIETGNKHK